MTRPDHDPSVPFVSREEERQRLLAEAVAHASAQDEAFRQRGEAVEATAAWKVPVALALFLLAAVVALFPPSWLVPQARPQLRPADQAYGARAALYLEAQQIEAFHLVRGRLPESLDEIGDRIPGVTFIRSNSRVYQLVMRRPDGSSLVYDSARPAPGFAAAAAGWSREAPSP